MTTAGRIGQFLFFIGFLVLVIFFASDQADSPYYLFFCGGVVLLLIGGALMWRYRNPPAPSERFRSWRKMNEKQKKKRDV